MAFSTFRDPGTPYSDRKRRRLPPEQPRGDQRPAGGFRVGQGAPRRERDGDGGDFLGKAKLATRLAKEGNKALSAFRGRDESSARNPEAESAYQEARAGERADIGAAGSVGGSDLSQFFGPEFSDATFSMPTGGESLLTPPSTIPVGAMEPNSIGGSIGAGMGSSTGMGAAPGATGGLNVGGALSGLGAGLNLYGGLSRMGDDAVGGGIMTAQGLLGAYQAAQAMGLLGTGALGTGGAAAASSMAAGGAATAGGAAAAGGAVAGPILAAIAAMYSNAESQAAKKAMNQAKESSGIKQDFAKAYGSLMDADRRYQAGEYKSPADMLKFGAGQLTQLPAISHYYSTGGGRHDRAENQFTGSKVGTRDVGDPGAEQRFGKMTDPAFQRGAYAGMKGLDAGINTEGWKPNTPGQFLGGSADPQPWGGVLDQSQDPNNYAGHISPLSVLRSLGLMGIPHPGGRGIQFMPGSFGSQMDPAGDSTLGPMSQVAPDISMQAGGEGKTPTRYYLGGEYESGGPGRTEELVRRALSAVYPGYNEGGQWDAKIAALAPGGGAGEGGSERGAVGKRGAAFAPAVGAVSEQAPQVGAAPGEGTRPEADLIKEAFGRRPGGMGIAPGGGAAGRSPFGVASQQNQRPQRNTTSTV